MKRVWNILKKIIDIFSWVIIGVMIITIIFSIIAHINGTIPSAFGYTICRISSGSMEPELQVGDVILGKTVSDPSTLKVGDIVTYKGRGELEDMFITHQVIVAPTFDDGVLMLQTKGTANNIPDSPIEAESVVSVMLCEVEFLNYFYSFFLSPWGLLTVVFLLIIIFIDELIAIIKNFKGNERTAKPESIDDIINKIKTDSEKNYDEESDVENQSVLENKENDI